jgi:hypothetical protein
LCWHPEQLTRLTFLLHGLVDFGLELDVQATMEGLVVLPPIVLLVKWSAKVLAEFHQQHW